MSDYIPDFSKYSDHDLSKLQKNIHGSSDKAIAEAIIAEINKRKKPETGLSVESNYQQPVTNAQNIQFMDTPDSVHIFDDDEKSTGNKINAVNRQNTRRGQRLPKDEQMIKEGGTAGVVLGFISFLTWLIAMITKQDAQGIPADPFGIVDVILIFGLSYGIFKKSRFCIVALTVYYILVKFYHILLTLPAGIFILIPAAIFTTFFIRGMIGIFEYHEKMNRAKLTTQQK